MKNRRLTTRCALTIAGSDSAGCAGIQADLRTFHNFKIHGAGAITCVTAQNTVGVQAMVFLEPRIIAAQIKSVVSDLACDAAKTGMLGSLGIVRTVARSIRQLGIRNVVVDPVMASSSGATLLRPDAITALRDELIPLGTLVTPNLAEAERLSGRKVVGTQTMEIAAERIFHQTGCAVLVKGGHLPGRAVDIFFDGSKHVRLSAPRIRTRHARGSGCVLSAAIAALLALGNPLDDAVTGAKDYVTRALENGYKIGKGSGPLGDP